MRKQIASLLACGLLAGCSFTSGVNIAAPAAVALVSFDACSDVLDYLKSEAQERVGPWGLAPDSFLETDDSRVAAEDAAAVGPEPSTYTGSAPDHSTTNVQEVGVDEPDIVKTDGRIMVTTVAASLRVIDVSGDAPVEVGALDLDREYADASVLLDGDRAMLFVREFSQAMPAIDASTYPAWTPQRTSVLLVDLSDPSEPTVEDTLEVDGDYLDARMVGDTVRVVVRSQPTLEFPMSPADVNSSEEELTTRNRDVIAASEIDDWLPSYRLDGAEDASGRLVDCDQIRHPDEFAGFSTLSVLTLDFDRLSAGSAVGVLTDGDTVYASTDRLYVATTRWGAITPMVDPMGMPAEPDVGTGIHAFDTTGDGPARYVASGRVDGTMIGRYAMSEHNGVLRVAITDSPGGQWGDPSTAESHLVTLTERDGELVELGRVSGLGKGEQIYAVRYFGDVGYVVTFRQVDPLYVLDLSDPAHPSVEGELKITGYSSYLHDVGDGRLIGVGQEATPDGMAVGAQVSLFDVSDPSSPQKLDGHVSPGGWSDVGWDPHAFLYWPETRQLVIPMQGPTGQGGALALRVGDDDLTELGSIEAAAESSPDGYFGTVRRSVVVGDSLYTLWEAGLQVNDLDGLARTAWLPLS